MSPADAIKRLREIRRDNRVAGKECVVWPLRSAHPPPAPSRTPTPHRPTLPRPRCPPARLACRGKFSKDENLEGASGAPAFPLRGPPHSAPLSQPLATPLTTPSRLPSLPPSHAQLRRPCWQRGWTKTWCKRPSRRSRPRRYSARPPAARALARAARKAPPLSLLHVKPPLVDKALFAPLLCLAHTPSASGQREAAAQPCSPPSPPLLLPPLRPAPALRCPRRAAHWTRTGLPLPLQEEWGLREGPVLRWTAAQFGRAPGSVGGGRGSWLRAPSRRRTAQNWPLAQPPRLL